VRNKGSDVEIAPKELADKPIKLPASPFWTVFKRFGRDEAIAMVVNIVGTAITSFFTSNPLFLSVSGPILEKIGFFPAHFREAWIVYKTTPEPQRKDLSFYFWRALKGGSISLAEDIVIHDPVYIGLMYLGIMVSPGIPVWILAALSFIIAVIVVSFIEVGATEIRYAICKNRLRSSGFDYESYYESRFYISSEMDPHKVVTKLSEAFELNSWGKLEYRDIYLGNNIPHYSGRLPKLRLRRRTPYEISSTNVQEVVDRDGYLQTAQVVFTRASEIGRCVDQCRYFPLRKDKFYFFLDQVMPEKIGQIKNERVRQLLTRMRDRDDPLKIVTFHRTLAQNASLLASVDDMDDRPFYLLELKSYDARTLQSAMRFAMMEFPVVQTTYGKHDILRNCDEEVSINSDNI
jgi:hypothetical protein